MNILNENQTVSHLYRIYFDYSTQLDMPRFVTATKLNMGITEFFCQYNNYDMYLVFLVVFFHRYLLQVHITPFSFYTITSIWSYCSLVSFFSLTACYSSYASVTPSPSPTRRTNRAWNPIFTVTLIDCLFSLVYVRFD